MKHGGGEVEKGGGRRVPMGGAWIVAGRVGAKGAVTANCVLCAHNPACGRLHQHKPILKEISRVLVGPIT